MFETEHGYFVAHRGLGAENTLSAFIEAYHQGFSVSECDMHVTRDGQVVICHDETLERTAMCGVDLSDDEYQKIIKTPISQLSYQQCKKIRVGDSDHQEPVPLLSNFIAALPAHKQMLAEVKFKDKAAVAPFLDVIAARLADVIVIGFDFDMLQEIKRQCPACKIVFLTVNKPEGEPYVVVNDQQSLSRVLRQVEEGHLDGIGFQASGFITEENLTRLPQGMYTQVWSDANQGDAVVLELAAAVAAKVTFINVDNIDLLQQLQRR